MTLVVEFADPKLESLYFDQDAPSSHMSKELIRTYRKVVGLLYSVNDDQELRAYKSLRLEQLKGKRRGQWSLRLSRNDRLIVEFKTDQRGRVVVVVEIIDHDHY